MTEHSRMQNEAKVLILRTQRCRKSDAVIRFLENENIPFRVLHLETEPQAQELARQWNLKSSPGIIVGNRQIFAADILENCRIKNREQTKQMFLKMLNDTKMK